MLELPEAAVVAKQIGQSLTGKGVREVVAGQTPHKLTWYAGDPASYPSLLKGTKVLSARPVGGMVEVSLGRSTMLFSDGVNLRLYEGPDEAPAKHQLLVRFADSSCLVAVVQMYGGVCCFPAGGYDNKYYLGALAKPSPLTREFTERYFRGLLASSPLGKLSTKGFLATEQRIPGLGNGVLQDILFNARVHPRRRMDTLSKDETAALYHAIKQTLARMAEQGGRDSEKDLFGNPGGYEVLLGKRTAGAPCPVCGATIEKASYMGGSIYYCSVCQNP